MFKFIPEGVKITCENCGHERHCWTSLRKQVDKENGEIEVCKTCSCDICKTPEWVVEELEKYEKGLKSRVEVWS